ncbi:uncharacterized protein LOC126878666 [Diabrotica virgifera virgifera]|uniref:Uncharacterized protein LOC114345369 n=1 Tax=Diabrotica virgifera virgifera TaxID=50390 RepID=A0A6P7H2Q3_DIAVI|nr:uncharacterized protein LOC126878666 [Diabrotica virgifera virgifera]
MAEDKSFLMKVVDSLIPPPWEEKSKVNQPCMMYRAADALKTSFLSRLGSTAGAQEMSFNYTLNLGPAESESSTQTEDVSSAKASTEQPVADEGATQPTKDLKE